MSGQDWIEKDFYAVLGVPKDADAATIKKAYRKLARTLHPDHNPGDAKSEERFKEVGEAYAVLSDPEQHAQYDQLRAMAGGPRFSAGAGGAGGSGGFEDLFGGMFGGGGAPGGGRVRYSTQGGGFEDLLGGMFGGGGGFRQPRRGGDVTATTTLPFRQAASGSTVTLSVDGRNVTTRVPAGVSDGQKIRLRGKGQPGESGAPAGDLVITVSVTPHPLFSLDGNNVRITVPVAFDEA
ncbi:MAG TPA: DnaJ domain-containing protein, partial [Cellulomonadaceae bacterium]|nr:DnaJ domain-containing protein [Cellulomonadaceae bacterium]